MVATTNEEGLGSRHRSQRSFVPKKGKIYLLSRVERGSAGVYKGLVEKGIHWTIEVTTDITSVLCAEKGWKEEDSARL